MSFQQIAKLYLRGSVFSQKLKNLPKEEIEYLSGIIEKLIEDPVLQHCKIEFCRALSVTIKNEYLDQDVGLQDYYIALMRATISTYMKCGKAFDIDPTLTLQKILDDPIQRKKWYQTWIFNYLKQILRENKISTISINSHNSNTIDQLLLTQISSILSRKHISHTIIRNTIKYDNITIEDRNEISKLIEEYLSRGVIVIFDQNHITVAPCEISEDRMEVVSVREYSFNNQDEEVRNYLQSKVPYTGGNEMENEIIDKLKERVPDYAQPILKIYLENERPDDYVNKYGEGRPRAAHISEYLQIPIKEVKRIIDMIKIHLMVLQLGY